MKRYGQRCPREDLWPENRIAVRLAQLMLNEELRPLAAGYLRDAGPASEDGRARLVMIVAGALNDKRVRDERSALIDRMSRSPKAGTNMLEREPPSARGSALPLELKAVTVVNGRVVEG